MTFPPSFLENLFYNVKFDLLLAVQQFSSFYIRWNFSPARFPSGRKSNKYNVRKFVQVGTQDRGGWDTGLGSRSQEGRRRLEEGRGIKFPFFTIIPAVNKFLCTPISSKIPVYS